MDNQHEQPLRIAVVTETFPPEINGVANTMQQLVTGLAERGHHLFLVRPRQVTDRRRRTPRGHFLVPGLPIPGYRGLRFGLPVYWRLRHLWLRLRPDVLYVATQGPLGHAALNAGLNASIPVITGFHTQFHQYSQHYGLGLLTRPIEQTLRNFHNRSDATLVPTAALRTQLHESGFRNVHVFSRGVDTALFDPARRSAALRRDWGCEPDSLVALYVGRIAAEKNIHLALETMDALGARLPSLRCVLVGDGPERARLARNHPNCRFVGARVGEELAAHYASGDLFLFPSLTETFGNVVTEAMASGLAVCAFDYAAAHEHIHAGVNGQLVPFDDAEQFVARALALVEQPEQVRAMGKAARSTAAALSWSRVIAGVEERLRDVVGGRSARPAPKAVEAAETAPSGNGV
ncbi:glycosyltransferase family 1 protein [Thiohalocapsa sp. ML1]|jgi:glycosyltransferase involved in cell wall biosynthesis|uniref:glycosyltransferase family 4 protein n=1 Tax=Thiohalocapsa sp. ML1 TaxID=1431688 RepID=UPI0009EA304F|nr:glycosyltransferase family 1 protein [Thiohalocapsa sp. ML1]